MTREEGMAVLAEQRARIDEIDRRILSLLNERTCIVEQIGDVKRQIAMEVFEPSREKDVHRNIEAHNHGPLPADAARRIFEAIVGEMREVQRRRIVGR